MKYKIDMKQEVCLVKEAYLDGKAFVVVSILEPHSSISLQSTQLRLSMLNSFIETRRSKQ
jgi:hypothetical protein